MVGGGCARIAYIGLEQLLDSKHSLWPAAEAWCPCPRTCPRFWDVREREARRNYSTVATPAPNLNLAWSADGHYLMVRPHSISQWLTKP